MKKLLDPKKKIAGTLAPLFALRGKSDLGIGDVGTLRELVDWASAQGLRFVQMLPINQTGNDHSPYNLISSMALEPLTISCRPEDFPELTQQVSKKELEKFPATPAGPVDYQGVVAKKKALFELAFQRFSSFKSKTYRHAEFASFCKTEKGWLAPYALHQALTEWNGGKEVITEWQEEHRTLKSALAWKKSLPDNELKHLESRETFWSFIQWIAYTQWKKAKAYAEKKGVSLIGDVPVGVSIYSVDVWESPKIFDLERSCGAPAEKVFQGDPFTMRWGQNWGFPLYNWQEMSHSNFAWWRRRLRSLKSFFHLLRVDHALGFYRIYSFPWRPERNWEFAEISREQAAEKTGGKLPGFVPHEDDTEENRAANCKCGETLLGILAEETGAHGLIAEDLGEVPPYVRPSLAKLGLPGFKIPQWEHEGDGQLTPGEQYPRLSITTYATHDHPPLSVIWEEIVEKTRSGDGYVAGGAHEELRKLVRFAGGEDPTPREYSPEVQGLLLRGLWKSNSWLAAVNINDLLGTNDRFNVPGTTCGQNWSARLEAPISQWKSAYSPAIDSWKSDLKEMRP